MRPNLDAYSTVPDPAESTQAAHELARTLITDPHLPRDQHATARFVALEREFGIDTIAALWSTAPAVSLPGSLWRLYALHRWLTHHSEQAARWYSQGLTISVAEVVAAIPSPPIPSEVTALAREVLSGAFNGDYAAACERAAAFIAVAARGRATDDDSPGHTAAPRGPNHAKGKERGKVATTSAKGKMPTSGLHEFARMGEDLQRAANAYRAGTLD